MPPLRKQKKTNRHGDPKYGTETKAAEALGVNQSTISRKMKYYGL
jgi:DNA-binding NtrC family response regulator